MPTATGRVQVVNRLKSVDGHLRGVIRMVDEGVYCMDVIKQLQAVQAAIGRVNALLLEDHLESCVTTAIRGQDPQERARVIGELLGLFEQGLHLEGELAQQLSDVVQAGTEAAPGPQQTEPLSVGKEAYHHGHH